MYVAMTRAKKDLYLTTHSIPSRFLREIPPELVEVTGIQPLGNPEEDENRYISLE